MEEKRTSNRKSIVGVVVALVALVVVIGAGYLAYQQLIGAAAKSPAQASSAAGTTSADSSGSSDEDAIWLSDYDATVFDEYGDATTLTRIADGRPLVMNFWATWCPYCIQEMDDFQAIYNDYADEVSFAFIDCVDGTRETADDGAAWLLENDYLLPAYYDNKQEAQASFGITSLPTTIIVDRNGEILTISAGKIDPERMRNALDTVIAE